MGVSLAQKGLLILRQQQEMFISLVSHNLFLLSWCNLNSNQIDQGHGVTFEVKDMSNGNPPFWSLTIFLNQR